MIIQNSVTKDNKGNIIYNEGQFLGPEGLIFLEEIDPHVSKNGRKRRKAMCLCHCGEPFPAMIQDIKSGATSQCKECGKAAVAAKNRTPERRALAAKNAKAATKANTQDGLSSSKLGHIHKAMVSRCYNHKDSRFSCYGREGVQVCEEWRPDKFGGLLSYSQARENYITWVEANLPWEEGMHIDKVYDAAGYRPGNLQILTGEDNSRKVQLRKQGITLFRLDSSPECSYATGTIQACGVTYSNCDD